MAQQHWTDRVAPLAVLAGLALLGIIMYLQYKQTQEFINAHKRK